MTNKQKTQKDRLQYAAMMIEQAGYDILSSSSDYQLQFLHNGHKVYLFPYTGWHSGTPIIDGRGLNNLLTQI